MIDNNLILYLPFDDPDGSKAYDFSLSRADATLSDGASFSKTAKIGKSLSMNGAGECQTEKAIPFSGDFTLSCYVYPATSKLGWLLNFDGVDNYLEQWVNVMPKNWYFFAFVKSGNTFEVYQNTSRIFKETISGTPKGLSLNDESLNGTQSLIDELRLFNVAKTPTEVMKLQANTDVEYYIDGKNMKDFGVYVSASSGLLGRLERKESLEVDWDNYHGKVIDLKRPRYKERTITLDCFIEASSRSEFVNWVNLFMEQFDKEGTVRLKCEYDGKAKPLVYEVYVPDDVDVDKTWGTYNNDIMVGTFSLKLVECEPVKRVLRHIGNANSKATITVTSTKFLNVYWGDGSHTFNVHGADVALEHTYEEAGEYDIIVSGVIEDIEEFSTNAIVIWEKLK